MGNSAFNECLGVSCSFVMSFIHIIQGRKEFPRKVLQLLSEPSMVARKHNMWATQHFCLLESSPRIRCSLTTLFCINSNVELMLHYSSQIRTEQCECDILVTRYCIMRNRLIRTLSFYVTASRLKEPKSNLSPYHHP